MKMKSYTYQYTRTIEKKSQMIVGIWMEEESSSTQINNIKKQKFEVK